LLSNFLKATKLRMFKQIFRISAQSFPRRLSAVTVFDEFLKDDTYLFLRTYATEGSFKHNPNRSAFENIADATVEFISSVYSTEARIQRVQKDFPELVGNDACIVPVHAYQFIEINDSEYVFKVGTAGLNLMTLIASILLLEKTNIDIDFGITQNDSNSRNASTDRHRFMCPTSFKGNVTTGKKYVVFDDHIKTGNTVANLAGHIHVGGGEVLGFYTFSCNEIALDGLYLDEVKLMALREQMFAGAEGLFRREFGYGFDGLTRVEANLLPTLVRSKEDWISLINYSSNPEPGMFRKPPEFCELPQRKSVISLAPLGILKNLVIVP